MINFDKLDNPQVEEEGDRREGLTEGRRRCATRAEGRGALVRSRGACNRRDKVQGQSFCHLPSRAMPWLTSFLLGNWTIELNVD